MKTTTRTARWAAAAALCLLAAGCGQRRNEDSSAAAPSTYNRDLVFSPAGALVRAGDIYDIIEVVPPSGPLAGGNAAELRGIFPNPLTPLQLSIIQSTYSVFFGTNLAPYDTGNPPIVAAGAIHVTVPQGNAPGLVDVIFRDMTTLRDAATLYQGYEYLDPYDIVDVVPDQGPTAGGQQVTVVGRFPILAPMATVAEAYAAYRVYIDARPAPFDPSFSPVITDTEMHVITPPRLIPGLVDVSVATTVPPSQSPDFRILADGYEYINTSYNIYQVVPNIGWIFGDEPADVQGTYPVSNAFSQSLLGNIAGAAQYYNVYFDGRLAPFDAAVLTPVITANDMYVRSPFGDDVEIVDVTIISHDGPDYSNTEIALLQQAYRYYAMYLTRCIPPQGPMIGGTTVVLEGFLPGLAAIDNIYVAEAAYTVYFGGNQANFVSVPAVPVFEPSVILSMASRIYTTGRMYVTAPPSTFAGFVDVRIVDDTGKDLPTTLRDGYLYTNLTGIGKWTGAEIFPNPVGMIPAGDLLVRVTVTGEVDGDDDVFIVPQGGNPAVSSNRIHLTELSAGDVNGEWVWVGTNRDAIPRIISSNLLVDGHAAIYIINEDGTIVGDDTSDLTDGGIIEGQALEGRHFLIDTIPPRLRIDPQAYLRGDNFVSLDIPGNWTLNDLDTGTPFPANIAAPHAYPTTSLSGYVNTFNDAPYDGHWMFRPATTDSMAQVFFKVSSTTNFFADSAPNAAGEPTANLQYTVTAQFEDVDVYTMLGRTPTTADVDRFTGSTIRQVGGFALAPVSPLIGLRDSVLVDNDDVLIRWDFQPTAFRLPEISGIQVDYTPNGPLAAGAAPSLSGNLRATPTWLTGTFRLGDPSDPLTGVQLGDAGLRNLISVVFRAVDRAGDYFPRGDVSRGRHKILTQNDSSGSDQYIPAQQPDVGPLNMWWLRTTATRLSSTIPASGDVVAPSFSWENTGVPDPGAYVDRNDFTGAERIFSYAIYRTDPSLGNRDEQRAGPYTLVGSLTDTNGNGGAGAWSGWTARRSLSPADVQQIIASDGGLTEGVWFLLVVMSCDEAGNIEIWPEQQLLATGLSNSIDGVTDANPNEERNWDRWFVPPSGGQVDTRIEPFFWHDKGTGTSPALFDGNGEFDPNEVNFGDADVIPYPPATMFGRNLIYQRVTGLFRMTAIADQGALSIEWEILENGTSLLADVISPCDASNIVQPCVLGDTFALTHPDIGNGTAALGLDTRQPTYYTMRARAFIDTDANGALDSGEIYDTSPATVQFVVVDNVAQFIQNPKSVDLQPIQEMDRP